VRGFYIGALYKRKSNPPCLYDLQNHELHYFEKKRTETFSLPEDIF